MKRRPTQLDVATLAGVSPGIVSTIINNRTNGNIRISEATQQRVLDAIKELGYVPNPVARSLAGGQNRLLGVFTYEALFPLEYRNFYYEFLIGIEKEAEVRDYNLLFFTRNQGTPQRLIYQNGVNSLQLADGAILLGLGTDREELARLNTESYPFVFIGRREIKNGQISYVAADYKRATREIVEYTINKGHRRLALIQGNWRAEPQLDKQAGYYEAAAINGLNEAIAEIHYKDNDQITVEWVKTLFDKGITAFIIESTAQARRLADIAAQLGKYAPADFSFAVLGDPMSLEEMIPEATTYLTPRQEMGAQAVRLLCEILTAGGEIEPRQVILPCRFQPGNTVGPSPHPA
jgi:DNA-binding LacI/PurR family transcriptional regulator